MIGESDLWGAGTILIGALLGLRDLIAERVDRSLIEQHVPAFDDYEISKVPCDFEKAKW